MSSGIMSGGGAGTLGKSGAMLRLARAMLPELPLSIRCKVLIDGGRGGGAEGASGGGIVSQTRRELPAPCGAGAASNMPRVFRGGTGAASQPLRELPAPCGEGAASSMLTVSRGGSGAASQPRRELPARCRTGAALEVPRVSTGDSWALEGG